MLWVFLGLLVGLRYGADADVVSLLAILLGFLRISDVLSPFYLGVDELLDLGAPLL